MSSLRFNPFTGNFDFTQGSDGNNPIALDAERLIATRVAEETISALRLVTASSNNEVRLAQPNQNFEDAQVLGLALNSANAGNEVQVLLSGAESNAIFNGFTLNGKLYLGNNGLVTQTPPTSGHQTDVGEFIGDNTVFIFRRQPIIL